jgi:hypothetical protein
LLGLAPMRRTVKKSVSAPCRKRQLRPRTSAGLYCVMAQNAGLACTMGLSGSQGLVNRKLGRAQRRRCTDRKRGTWEPGGRCGSGACNTNGNEEGLGGGPPLCTGARHTSGACRSPHVVWDRYGARAPNKGGSSGRGPPVFPGPHVPSRFTKSGVFFLCIPNSCRPLRSTRCHPPTASPSVQAAGHGEGGGGGPAHAPDSTAVNGAQHKFLRNPPPTPQGTQLQGQHVAVTRTPSIRAPASSSEGPDTRWNTRQASRPNDAAQGTRSQLGRMSRVVDGWATRHTPTKPSQPS